MFDNPPSLSRNPKRPLVKVKQDIETTNKILREDIYDILKTYETKSKNEAKQELRNFLSSLTSKAIEYKGSKNTGIERVISDIDSYGINFKKEA